MIMEPSDGSLMTRAAVLEIMPKLDAIINHGDLLVDEAFLALAPRLSIVANMSVGFNNLNLEAMTRHGVWGTNAPENRSWRLPRTRPLACCWPWRAGFVRSTSTFTPANGPRMVSVPRNRTPCAYRTR